MIYTDGTHMISSESLAELHEFALHTLGLPQRWFHASPRHPHYDLLTDESRELAFTSGAQRIRPREIIRIIRDNPHLMRLN